MKLTPEQTRELQMALRSMRGTSVETGLKMLLKLRLEHHRDACMQMTTDRVQLFQGKAQEVVSILEALEDLLK